MCCANVRTILIVRRRKRNVCSFVIDFAICGGGGSGGGLLPSESHQIGLSFSGFGANFV